MDNSTTKGGTLIWVKVMMHQFVTCHPTNCMNEILTVEIFETVFIGIMCVGLTVELMGRRVLNPVLITSILGRMSKYMER